MKNLFFLFILLMIINCSSNKGVYWCGDHPCKNKKEKEAYFKKTMIVEIKTSINKNYKNNSEIEKIMQEAQSKAKKIIKDETNASVNFFDKSHLTVTGQRKVAQVFAKTIRNLRDEGPEAADFFRLREKTIRNILEQDFSEKYKTVEDD